KFVMAAAKTQSLERLRQYVRERMNRSDCWFYGIFEPATNRHIGNIKFEPIDYERKYTVIGMVIGDTTWRGKGVIKEVFVRLAETLHAAAGIKDFWLGVRRQNTSALKAYLKMGFREEEPAVKFWDFRYDDGFFMRYTMDSKSGH